MANNMVGIRAEGAETLRKLCRRKGVSKQGLITALVSMANGDRPDLGIIDLDWDKIKEEYPTTKDRNRKNWTFVVAAVRELMNEFDTAEEISMHCRFTLAQVDRAMKEIKDADRS